MKMKKYFYIIALTMGLAALTACTKKTDNEKSSTQYELISQSNSSNYSCENADGETIFGNRMTCELEISGTPDEKEQLQAIAKHVDETEEEQGIKVIEVTAVCKFSDGTEKTYLLRGENSESLITEENGKEVYQDWNQ